MADAPAGMELSDKARILSKVPLFAALTPAALELVARVTHAEEHPKGARIFSYGDEGDKLYIVVRGHVRISRDVPGMGEETMAILEAGAIFGEMALLDESPRSADAIAHERCELCSIDRESFEDLLFLHKDLAYEVLWCMVKILSARLRDTTDKLAFLSVTSKF
jgi:CRP-like cAMP-binding protein